MTLIRGYNLVLGVTLCLAALLAIGSMAHGMSRYAEEPEDVWLLAFGLHFSRRSQPCVSRTDFVAGWLARSGLGPATCSPYRQSG